MSKFLSNKNSELVAYVPGEQPKNKLYIKLNTNESPYPPSEIAINRINREELSDLRLYSDPDATVLVQAIAEYYNIGSENVIVGNGSDELLAFCFQAFFDDIRQVCYPDITYGFYDVYSQLYNLSQNHIALKEDFSIDIEKFKNTDMGIIIANPNAQTGRYLDIMQIESIVQSNVNRLVIVDEAYIDFGGVSAVGLTKKYDNVIVIQTLSKSRSLAGARIGLAIANASIIEDLKLIKYSFNPYNLNRMSILLGAESIKDIDYFNQNVAKIIKTRDKTCQQLKELDCEVVDTMSNFILVRSDKISGIEWYNRLKQKGILVRHLSNYRIADYIRVTIGLEEEMNKFIQLTKEIFSEV